MIKERINPYSMARNAITPPIFESAPQPAPVQQEPVYFCDYGYEGWGKVDAAMAAENRACGMTVEAYYTSPPAQRTWVGLTDDEIWDAYVRSPVCVNDSSLVHLYAFGRAIEAKLKEKNTCLN